VQHHVSQQLRDHLQKHIFAKLLKQFEYAEDPMLKLVHQGQANHLGFSARVHEQLSFAVSCQHLPHAKLFQRDQKGQPLQVHHQHVLEKDQVHTVQVRQLGEG
jgi:hypothetical protein